MDSIVFAPIPSKVRDEVFATLAQMFGYRNVKLFFKNKKLLITKGGPRQEVFAVTNEQFNFIFNKVKTELGREPYCAGVFVGIYGKKFKPSLDICEKLFKMAKRNAIMINEQAAILFSYGRDVMLKSITKVYEPLHEIVVVIDPQENVIGLCKLITRNLNKTLCNKCIVCENIIDKGWYLRKGH